jgi:ADP-ribose pyrophosphatase YjhB (NUDIX family)
MQLKIYFGDKPLFLCDEITEEIETIKHHDDAVYIDEFSTPAIKSMLHEMQVPKVHAGIFFHSNLEALKKAFWKRFDIIKAGGGLVLNSQQEALLIFRLGKWDLPKGKLDPGETIEQCALREVEEECGITGLHLGSLLQVTYHTYDLNGKHILKETYWFKMEYPGNESLTPQTEEDITGIRWVSKANIGECLMNTYPAVATVITEHFLNTA